MISQTAGFTLTSTAFTEGAAIPSRFTCDGVGTAPPLAWAGAPSGTKSFALIADDPDAPDPKAPKVTWVHWVLYDIPASAHSLPEGVTSQTLPAGTREGVNGWKKPGYGGPCPPIGRHRYFFKLYALDAALGDLGSADKAKVQAAMKGHVVGHAELMGTYQKGER
jgi:Raf kinase inhibitor-like YbhB/YbcL family protein